MKPMKPMEPMQGMKPMEPMQPLKPAGADRWWPEALGGEPNSAGGQNEMRYAYFAEKHRLVVGLDGGSVTVYDTTGHEVSGVQQDQSEGSRKLQFTGGGKTMDLDQLKTVLN